MPTCYITTSCLNMATLKVFSSLVWASFFPKLAFVLVLRAFFLRPDCEILPKKKSLMQISGISCFFEEFLFVAEVEITIIF